MQSIISWQTIWYLILVLYIPACLGLIVVVLLQKGKGVGFAGAFGMGGGSDTVFGPRASKSLPQRLTYIMAGLFMALALVMSLIAGRTGAGVAPETVSESAEDYSALEDLGTAVEGGEGQAAPAQPAAPAAPAATTEAPAQPAQPVEEAAPAADTPAAPATETPAAAPEAVVQTPTGEAGAAIPPSVEAPKPIEASPDQGSPPAVPVPPAPPATTGAQ